MKVVKNYLWNMFYQVFVVLVPFITIPYISRVLGPTGVGINSYTNSMAQYFILLGSLGINMYGNRQIAYDRDDKNKMSERFWEIFILRLMTITFAILFYFICMIFWDGYTNYFLAQSLQILAVAFDISWFFMGVENFRVTVLRNILVKLLSVILIFTLVKDKSDTLMYILLIGASSLIGNITLFPYLKRYILWSGFRNLDIIKNLKPSLVLFIPQIAIQIYISFNKSMLGKFVSVESSGYFDNADKIVRIMLAVATAAGTVLLPHVASLFAKKEFEKVKESLYVSFDFVSFITVPMAFGLAAVANKFAVLFFGYDFAVVGGLLIIESIAAVFMTWANAIGTQYLIPTNQNRSYTLAVTVGAIVNIVFNIPLIFLWGAQGAMLATVFSEISVTFYMLESIKKQVDIKKMFTGLWKYILSGTIMYAVILFIDSKTSVTWPYLILEFFIGIIVYSVCVYLLHPKLVDNTRNLLK